MPAHILLLVAALLPTTLFANETVTIAVASNFTSTARELAAEYSRRSGVPVRISSGSTGKLYVQIINGAPFDVFLAADSERPRLLEQSGYIVGGTRSTYAVGGLVLWSQDKSMRGRDCREALQRGDYGRLAVANPETAPYGMAARDFLLAEGLWESAAKHAVYGENIAQTMQFVATGNATLGFVASSQIMHPNLPAPTCMWRVPNASHAPITQQLVLLERAASSDGARGFIEYLQTPEAGEIIARHGYGLVR